MLWSITWLRLIASVMLMQLSAGRHGSLKPQMRPADGVAHLPNLVVCSAVVCECKDMQVLSVQASPKYC